MDGEAKGEGLGYVHYLSKLFFQIWFYFLNIGFSFTIYLPYLK